MSPGPTRTRSSGTGASHAHHLGLAEGLTDAAHVRTIRELSDAVAIVDGHGFRSRRSAGPRHCPTRSDTRHLEACG